MRNLHGYGAALLLLSSACSAGNQSVVGAPPDPATGTDDESFDAGGELAPELDAGQAPPPVPVDPVVDAGPPAPLADVEVVITTDNAFSFGYGDAQSVTTFMQGVPSGAGEIFDCPVDYGPEPFVVPGEQAPEDAYLYIVAWADDEWTQGALAQFRRANSDAPLYSGDAEWEVCATGVSYDGFGNGPDQGVVNQYVAECQKGAQGSTYSKGWVDRNGAVSLGALGKLAVGEPNDAAEGDFPVVCQSDDAGVAGMNVDAKWMWFDPEDGVSPFVGNLENRTKAFLIFRLPAVVLF